MSKGEDQKGAKKKRIQMMNGKDETAKVIKAQPKNDGQRNVLRAIDENTVTLINGVPGTGKTHVAVAYGLQMMFRGKFKRMVITRPYVEAGEHLGFLPGTMEEKAAPFLLPIFDILGKFLSKADIEEFMEDGRIMILPLAFMRGVTFEDSYVLCDEAQNATGKQLHMLLTRVGERSKVVVAGDPVQSDIGKASGLKDACERLEGVKGLEVVELDASCVVRDPIVAEINARYGGYQN